MYKIVIVTRTTAFALLKHSRGVAADEIQHT
jgi:hypothetical protein